MKKKNAASSSAAEKVVDDDEDSLELLANKDSDIPLSLAQSDAASVGGVILSNRPPLLDETTETGKNLKITGEDANLEAVMNESCVLTGKGFTFRPTSANIVRSDTKICMHSQNCKIRDPFPPPLPALIPLKNRELDYHNRFLEGLLN